MVAEQRVCKYTLSTPSVRPASMCQWGCSQQLVLQHTDWRSSNWQHGTLTFFSLPSIHSLRHAHRWTGIGLQACTSVHPFTAKKRFHARLL